MFAATAAGLYAKVEDAMLAMGQGFDAMYEPNPEKVKIYQKRYEHYKKVGAFMEAQLGNNY
jgi:L-ribulokinase